MIPNTDLYCTEEERVIAKQRWVSLSPDDAKRIKEAEAQILAKYRARKAQKQYENFGSGPSRSGLTGFLGNIGSPGPMASAQTMNSSTFAGFSESMGPSNSSGVSGGSGAFGTYEIARKNAFPGKNRDSRDSGPY